MSGLKINGYKKLSITDNIVDFTDVKKVYVPLINQNVKCILKTKVGKKVKKGSIIGLREDIDFPILSPVSGIVSDIKPHLHSSGTIVDCVVIDNDLKEACVKRELKDDFTTYTKEEFIDLLKMCGVVGMGGSEFPTFMKYKCDANILIVNAVECEPYLTCDTMLVKLKADIILECIDAIMKINGIKKCFIAYKRNNKIVYNSFMKYLGNYKNIILSPVEDIYPAGWERNVVKSVLKLDYDKYPSEIGVIVNNVSTILAIYKAIKYKRNVTKRIVTISGNGFSRPINVLVKSGTNMRKVIEKLGEFNKSSIVVAGGPLMGKKMPSIDFVISNNLGGITILENEKEEKTNCISCGKCIEVCPAHLNPIFIKENLNSKEKLSKLDVKKCVECGLCSYVCPAKIDLRDYVIEGKCKNV